MNSVLNTIDLHKIVTKHLVSGPPALQLSGTNQT